MNYEFYATDRKTSIFETDISKHHTDLLNCFKNSRICVIGGSGSIGSAVAKALLTYMPDTLSIIDINENGLSDLVRELRSNPELATPKNLEAIAIGIGSSEFKEYINNSKPFDYFFNLSAMKHVRSEKNVYSLKRMIDTNILYLNDFLNSLTYNPNKFFSVSSDKAVNPQNLMGASKNLMEQTLNYHSNKLTVSSARFANVAFSLGSLPHAFLTRIENQQPIAAPNDVRRFFISHQEAAELCLMSTALGSNQDIFVPNLSSGVHEKQFSKIAEDLLMGLGYEPYHCDSELHAKQLAPELIPQKKWPCFFSESNTTGEKPFEEFYADNDILNTDRFKTIGITKNLWDQEKIEQFKKFINFAEQGRTKTLDKSDYITEIQKCVPGLIHKETGKSLDDKM